LCVGRPWWNKRVHGVSVGESHTESILTLVDLASFKFIENLKTSTLDLLQFHSVWMDRLGNPVVAASDRSIGKYFVLQLAMPSLKPGLRCDYSVVTDENPAEHPVPASAEACAAVTQNDSLEDYLREEPGASPSLAERGFTCSEPRLEYCPQPETFSTDRQVAMGVETEGHDNLLGSWVQSRAIAIFYSTGSKKEIARLDITQEPPYMKLASSNGNEYLLFLKDGSDLAVYRLPLQSQ
jgi:hypothetical protein